MKKRIGLTGGTGFIGQYLIRDYGDKYEFVAVTSRDDTAGLNPKADYIKTEYTREGFAKAFEGCDAIVHLGSHVIEGSEKELDTRPYIGNIDVADSVFSAGNKIGIKNIVNASSVAVYYQAEDHPLRETDPLLPNSIYGISKVAVESLARLYNERYDMRIKSLRYAQVLGLRHVHTLFYGMLLRNASQGEPITIWGDGIAARDIIYVRDAARAAVAAIEHPDCWGEYNVGHGYPSSNMDLAVAYRDGFQSDAEIIKVHVENEDKHSWCIDPKKIKDELQYEPMYSLLSMTRDMKREMEISRESGLSNANQG